MNSKYQPVKMKKEFPKHDFECPDCGHVIFGSQWDRWPHVSCPKCSNVKVSDFKPIPLIPLEDEQIPVFKG